MHKINQTIQLIKAALTNGMPINPELAKAFTQSASATTGLTFYDLEGPAKTLYPVLTPLRNAIPRVGGGAGIQANWKAILGVNVNNMGIGVGEGNRGGVTTTQVADYLAMFKGIGLEDYVTFEADMAATGYDDVRARSVEGLLRALMIGEEKVILGGNSSLSLGKTPQPTVVASNAGGSLAAGTYSVICAALTLDGYLAATVVGGVRGMVARTNADYSSETYGGGTAIPSNNATGVTAGATGSLTASLPSAVAGAVAYAWFWGAAGSETLGAITTINSVQITAAATGTQVASSLGASDNSTNHLLFDGLLTQIVKSGVSYVASQPNGAAGQGTPLTADGAGGIVEIDVALKWFWDNLRLSPTSIYVSSQEQQNITKKVLSGANNAAQRFSINTTQGQIAGGDLVVSYLNKFTMQGAKDIPIKLHPNLPAGTILFDTDQVPYPLSNVTNLKQIRTRQEYRQIDWALRSRKWEYGVYADEVLQVYFPPAFGLISNIGNG